MKLDAIIETAFALALSDGSFKDESDTINPNRSFTLLSGPMGIPGASPIVGTGPAWRCDGWW
jgi:hypothetical protein